MKLTVDQMANVARTLNNAAHAAEKEGYLHTAARDFKLSLEFRNAIMRKTKGDIKKHHANMAQSASANAARVLELVRARGGKA